jgi:hypothetical protein
VRTLKLFVLVCCCFIGTRLHAQTIVQIESDLQKTLDKINYWDRKTLSDTTDIDYNSLSKANEDLAKKLKYYGKENPYIIKQLFKKFGGISSADGLLNIFSWDTNMGGTQHAFENVILYRSGNQTSFLTGKTPDKGDYVYAYDKLYTLKVGNKTYYLATCYGIFDLYARSEGIRIFSIDNGKLNKKDLVKTATRVTNHLFYSYNQHLTNEDIMSETTIEYDPKEKTITFPVINAEGQQTDNPITYEFTGQYFERVKN